MKPHIKRLYSQLEMARVKIEKAQESCVHESVEKKYGSNTGNYDPSCDCYWTEFKCNDCGKFWSVEGSV
jgi:hypothetical protein